MKEKEYLSWQINNFLMDGEINIVHLFALLVSGFALCLSIGFAINDNDIIIFEDGATVESEITPEDIIQSNGLDISLTGDGVTIDYDFTELITSGDYIRFADDFVVKSNGDVYDGDGNLVAWVDNGNNDELIMHNASNGLSTSTDGLYLTDVTYDSENHSIYYTDSLNITHVIHAETTEISYDNETNTITYIANNGTIHHIVLVDN